MSISHPVKFTKDYSDKKTMEGTKAENKFNVILVACTIITKLKYCFQINKVQSY